MKHSTTTFILSVFLLGLASCTTAKKAREIEITKQSTLNKPKQKPKLKKGDIQPYNKVITDNAQTDHGLFKVHNVDGDFYYEIPDSLFDREMLMVTRISKTASGIGFGGGKQNTQVLRWQKKSKKVVLRVVSHAIVAADSLPIHEAVVNSNFEPVLYTFPIKAFGKDSLSTVIDISNLFQKDVKALGLPASRRKRYKITRLENDKSFIETIKSYPKNIEARHVKTYASGAPPSNSSTGTISIEINNSMILLPEEPMKRRYYDERVGWFARGQVDYGLEDQESKTVRYLDRWRLEVKDEDIDKHFETLTKGDITEGEEFPAFFMSCTTLKDPVSFNGRYHNFEVVTYVDYSSFEQFKGNENYQSPEYVVFKNKIIAKFLNSIEKIIPTAKQHIVQAELGTPKTNQFYINSTNGNVYGTEKTLNQVGPFSYKNKTEIDNLYLCGASTLSHGVTGATYSGLEAAARILNCHSSEFLIDDDSQEITIFNAELSPTQIVLPPEIVACASQRQFFIPETEIEVQPTPSVTLKL